MLSSKIKPNLEVAVYLEVSDLMAPGNYAAHGTDLAQPYWQNNTARGLPVAHRSARSVRHATVVETGVEMAKTSKGYSRYFGRTTGVLVRFAEPVVVRKGHEATEVVVEVTEAVVEPKRILEPWAVTVERRNAQAKYAADLLVTNRARALEMTERLEQFRTNLEAIGCETRLHNDLSGVYGDGFSVSLSSAVIDGERRVMSFGSSTMTVSRLMFEKLVAIAAKAGERIE